MILVDTNVVSETLRPAPNPGVIRWLDAQAANTLYLSTITLLELLIGIEFMPAGRRRSGLQIGLNDVIESLFSSRILPFDIPAARQCAVLIGEARKRGVSISRPDGQIAAIAAVNGFAVATRDATPFQAVGLNAINPWLAEH